MRRPLGSWATDTTPLHLLGRKDVLRPPPLTMAIRVEPPVCYVFRWEMANQGDGLRLPGDPRCNRLTCQYGMLQDESRLVGNKGDNHDTGRAVTPRGKTRACVCAVRVVHMFQGMDGCISFWPFGRGVDCDPLSACASPSPFLGFVMGILRVCWCSYGRDGRLFRVCDGV